MILFLRRCPHKGWSDAGGSATRMSCYCQARHNGSAAKDKPQVQHRISLKPTIILFGYVCPSFLPSVLHRVNLR